MNSISFNGKILPAEEPALLVANRGYRYGDGLFETMKLRDGVILLEKYHFERLFAGLSLMRMEIPRLFTAENLRQEILNLSKRNDCTQLARVRLSVFRGNGGLYDADTRLQYLAECWPLTPSVDRLNENGLFIGLYDGARKTSDPFSNLKSSNFLPYAMAAVHAKENKWNDCLVLNTNGNIADSSIANIFLIKNDILYTPSLEEGCVNGVMRRNILDFRLQIADLGLKIEETSIAPDQLVSSNEIFLTNAINGIRWVQRFGDKTYTNTQTFKIYNKLFAN